MDKNEVSSDEIIQGARVIAIVCAGVAIAPAAVTALILWKRPTISRNGGAERRVGAGLVFIALSYTVWVGLLAPDPFFAWEPLRVCLFRGLKLDALLRIIDVGWLGGMGVVLCLSPAISFFKPKRDFIRASDFKGKVKHFHGIQEAFENPLTAPIGVDVRDGTVVALDQKRRIHHVMTLGATGTGKTTLQLILALHAVRHGQPLVILDPKGDLSSLEQWIKQGRKLSPDFDQRFRAFTMSDPKRSASYNPLKHGNANQIKDRIMEALNWSEQYYQSVAGDFLTLLTSSSEYVGVPLTLESVSHFMLSREKHASVSKLLKKKADEGDIKAEILKERFDLLLKKMKPDDLLGLQSQLGILNNPTLGHLLSFQDAENEIDLNAVLEKNQIAYFQLDTLGNPDTARRLGRMIVEDLKGLASQVFHEVPEEKRKFFPIFIDEFGSFASKEFVEFLKQSRSAKFAVHLFSQGSEDLDVVSKEFGRQARSNPMTKIALRLDDSETVNEICSMAGTVDSLEQSYQVEGEWTQTKTGLGNMRETKQMRVEHDVLKNLNVGQAVVIEKSPSRVIPIQLCDIHLIDFQKPELGQCRDLLGGKL